MKFSILALLFLFLSKSVSEVKRPTVLISILARNKAHILPYFLTYLEALNYPKDRIALWLVVFTYKH